MIIAMIYGRTLELLAAPSHVTTEAELDKWIKEVFCVDGSAKWYFVEKISANVEFKVSLK
jgi:hypothetical protein